MSSRRALSNRTQHTPALSVGKGSQGRSNSSASFKRPRSPEPGEHLSASQSKRARGASTSASLREKERRRDKEDRLDKEQQKQEFREKYSKAFPLWTFYFDLDNISMKSSQVKLLTSRIEALGGVSRTHSILGERC